jgi:hypothetical protein
MKRIVLAFATVLAVSVLLPSSAFAVWHSASTSGSSTWQNPNGAANVTCWARMTFDISDTNPGVYRITKLEMRQTKNAGNVYVIGKIRAYICAHNYNTSNTSHSVSTFEHSWPDNGAWRTVPVSGYMTSGYAYPFTAALYSDWNALNFGAWYYIDGCDINNIAERFRLETQFQIRASSDGTLLKTVSVNVQPGL